MKINREAAAIIAGSKLLQLFNFWQSQAFENSWIFTMVLDKVKIPRMITFLPAPADGMCSVVQVLK